MAKYTTRNKALNRLQLKLPEFRFFSSAFLLSHNFCVVYFGLVLLGLTLILLCM